VSYFRLVVPLVDNNNGVAFVRFYNHGIVGCQFSFDGSDGVVLSLSAVHVTYRSVVLSSVSVFYVFRHCVSRGFLLVCGKHCNSIFSF
jgi:hypothetical protein